MTYFAKRVLATNDRRGRRDAKAGSENDIPKSVNRGMGGVQNAVRLSSASQAGALFPAGAGTVWRPLTDAAVSNQRADELHAQ